MRSEPLVEIPIEFAEGRYRPLPVTDDPVGLNFVAVAVPVFVIPVVDTAPAKVTD
jgi:hypothetical protein